MKKISLKNLNLNEVEQLSREQLKNVMGGSEAGSGSGSWECSGSCIKRIGGFDYEGRYVKTSLGVCVCVTAQ